VKFRISGRKLNGIMYLHRISDPRLGGVSRKNLRMFRKLCGDDKLGNVRIVTTNWSRVGEKEGTDRERDLATSNTAFGPLIEAGAILCRHYNTVETARSIISQLVMKDPVLMQIQEELNKGMKLGATSAGAVITEGLVRLQEKHKMEMELLKKEMEEAAKANDEALRAELAEERLVLAQKMAYADEDRKRLERTLDEARANLEMETRRLHEMQQRAAAESAKLREVMAAADRERERLARDMEIAREKADMERMELTKRAEEERKKHEQHIQDLHEKMTREFQDREDMQMKLKEAEESAKAENARVMAQLAHERERVIRAAEKDNLELQKKAQEADRLRRDLEDQMKEIERKKMELEEEAKRGLITRLFTETGSAMVSCVKVGEDVLGVTGGIGGALLGIGVAPVLGVWRTVFGR